MFIDKINPGKQPNVERRSTFLPPRFTVPERDREPWLRALLWNGTCNKQISMSQEVGSTKISEAQFMLLGHGLGLYFCSLLNRFYKGIRPEPDFICSMISSPAHTQSSLETKASTQSLLKTPWHVTLKNISLQLLKINWKLNGDTEVWIWTVQMNPLNSATCLVGKPSFEVREVRFVSLC